MGIEYSSESQEGLPVTGLPNALEVLKVVEYIQLLLGLPSFSNFTQFYQSYVSQCVMFQVARGKWVKKENTILRLKENGSKYRLCDTRNMYHTFNMGFIETLCQYKYNFTPNLISTNTQYLYL